MNAFPDTVIETKIMQIVNEKNQQTEMLVYVQAVESRRKIYNGIAFLDVVQKDLVKIDVPLVAIVNSKGTLLKLESTFF